MLELDDLGSGLEVAVVVHHGEVVLACQHGGEHYLKKRGQKRTHNQAVIALARRRIDVLWALLRDNRTWQTARPALAQAA